MESALQQHKDVAAVNAARAAVCNILRKSKPPIRNITKGEGSALNDLRSNEDIVIAKADKGNATVGMDREDYERKPWTFLKTSPFKK